MLWVSGRTINCGALPFLIPMAHSVEEMIDHVRDSSLASDLAQRGEQVDLAADLHSGVMVHPNLKGSSFDRIIGVEYATGSRVVRFIRCTPCRKTDENKPADFAISNT